MYLADGTKFRIGDKQEPKKKKRVLSEDQIDMFAQYHDNLDNEAPSAIINDEGMAESFPDVAEDLQSELDSTMITDPEMYEEYIIEELHNEAN